MRPFSWSSLIAARARAPLIFNRSTRADGVINFIFGISLKRRAYVSSSKSILFAIFSRVFPLLHFCGQSGDTKSKVRRTFFFDFPPAMAAAIFASFDFCCTLGGILLLFYRNDDDDVSSSRIGDFTAAKSEG